MAGAKAPVTLPTTSPQVCTCFNVNEDAIRHTLMTCEGDPSQRLAALQQRLRCGTNCGSCLPQVHWLVRGSSALTAA